MQTFLLKIEHSINLFFLSANNKSIDLWTPSVKKGFYMYGNLWFESKFEQLHWQVNFSCEKLK